MQNKSLLFIGDIHGHVEYLPSSLSRASHPDCIYQLGDFGFLNTNLVGRTPIGQMQLPPSLKFIRGNHDHPDAARNHPAYLGDFGVDTNGIGFISGGMSIDQQFRTPGVDWWPEEELSFRELDQAVDLMASLKPRVIITHVAPPSYEYHLVKFPKVSRTAQALGAILEVWQPEMWLCGHYHFNDNKRIEKTLFCCVGEHRSLALTMTEAPVSFRDFIFIE